MGIKGLAKLLADHAPGAMREQKFEDYFGRKIAIDASMHIYQFLVVVGRTGDQMLTNEAGDVTSHLQGMFFRTARMLESGMKPVYIFDGKPPDAKKEELNRRFEKRGDATEDLEKVKETGTVEDVEKYSKRTVRVTKDHNDECKRLLKLMGVPIIEAPSEAEAQCAAMCKDELVYAMASEDMDSLTFGTPRLTRNLMKPANAKVAVNEYEYQKVLDELKLTPEQFVDMCILCGCDYAGTIRGIGPGKAYSLIQKHGSMEEILANLDKAKYPVPDPYPYQEARRLFREPQVMRKDDIPAMKWGPPDEGGLVQFLVQEKGFNEDRVRKVVERIRGSRGKSNQGRLESFFGAASVKTSDMGVKRKDAEQKGGAAKKAKPDQKGAAPKKGKLGGIKAPKK